MTYPARLALIITLGIAIVACAGSPKAIGRMTSQQITGVSSKDLCYAFDNGQSQNPVVVKEVTQRRLNCGRVLLQAGIEPTGPASVQAQRLAPAGDCAGMEFMGVFVTEPVYGIRGQFAKIRNTAAFTKIVAVDFFQDGSAKVARSEVKAGEIGSVQLAVDDHPVTNVRLSSCR